MLKEANGATQTSMSVRQLLDLTGRVAVITGGSIGLGRQIAEGLAEMGALLVLCARKQERCQQVAEELGQLGVKAIALSCDVKNPVSIQRLIDDTLSQYGRIDVLVNNAAARGSSGPLHTMSLEKWDTVMNTNLRGVFYMLRAFVPLMISSGGGHVINISSLAGKNPLPNGAAYSASKWGVNGLSYSVAEELREHGIRVSVICPGSTHTDFSSHAGKHPEKMLQPDDVAHVVAMLVTQSAQSFASEVILRPTRKP